MKTANGFNYYQAVMWIALNDEEGARESIETDYVEGMVTVIMTADICNMTPHEVARDVIEIRQKVKSQTRQEQEEMQKWTDSPEEELKRRNK